MHPPWVPLSPYVMGIGLTHEITIVRGQGREGVYAEDRSIRVLGVEIPSVYLLPRLCFRSSFIAYSANALS